MGFLTTLLHMGHFSEAELLEDSWFSSIFLSLDLISANSVSCLDLISVNSVSSLCFSPVCSWIPPGQFSPRMSIRTLIVRAPSEDRRSPTTHLEWGIHFPNPQ